MVGSTSGGERDDRAVERDADARIRDARASERDVDATERDGLTFDRARYAQQREQAIRDRLRASESRATARDLAAHSRQQRDDSEAALEQLQFAHEIERSEADWLRQELGDALDAAEDERAEAVHERRAGL